MNNNGNIIVTLYNDKKESLKFYYLSNMNF